jgi:hypothetical protein
LSRGRLELFRCRISHFGRLSRRNRRQRIIDERISQRRHGRAATVAVPTGRAGNVGERRAARIGTAAAGSAAADSTTAATAAHAAMTPAPPTQVTAMKQPTAVSSAAAQVTRQEAIEHAADTVQEANRAQRPARFANVVTIGFDRHRSAAGPIGHGHVVPPALTGRRRADHGSCRAGS